MKTVNDSLNNYMNNEKNFETCDMYRLKLKDNSAFYYADYDVDVNYNAHVWKHNRGIFKRDSLKLTGQPTVDTLTVRVNCDETDKLNDVTFMKACHDGLLDQSYLTLYKAYFKDGEIVGVVPLFEGRVEIGSAGGLTVQLTVKSIIQGLAELIPVRMFAPQEAYHNANGTVTVSDTDNVSALIPLKPSSRVLVKI